MSATAHEGEITWSELALQKAAMIQQQVSALIKWAGDDKELAAQLTEPYFGLLEELYADEFPLAKAIDNSDLVLRLDGPAVSDRAPRISLIADIFSSVRKRVGSVAYAISGVITEKTVLPKDVDLGLSALAPGSLYLGFTLPDPAGELESGEKNLLGKEDPLYIATKKAIQTLGIVSQSLESKHPQDLIAAIPDPRVRDTALVAIQNLAPTGKKGIKSVSISGRSFDVTGNFHKLTAEIRATAKESADAMALAGEPASLAGNIREIDLDARRFELRRIAGSAVEEIRCVYPEAFEKLALKALDEQFQVMAQGTLQRSPDGRPKLLQVEFLQGPSAKPKQGDLSF